jgi:hypothetical protein
MTLPAHSGGTESATSTDRYETLACRALVRKGFNREAGRATRSEHRALLLTKIAEQAAPPSAQVEETWEGGCYEEVRFWHSRGAVRARIH